MKSNIIDLDNPELQLGNDFETTPFEEEESGPIDLDAVQEQAPEYTEDDFHIDAQSIADSRLLAHRFVEAPTLQSETQGHNIAVEMAMGMPARNTDELQATLAEEDAGDAEYEAAYRESLADSDLTKETLDWLGTTRWNLVKQGKLAFDVSDWAEEEQEALVRLMMQYDKLPISTETTKRALEGIATDYTSYVGFGFIAKALASVGLKGSAATLVKDFVSKKATGVGLVSAAEGATYAAADNIARQTIENKGDISQLDVKELATETAVATTVAGSAGYFLTRMFSRTGVDASPERVVEETPTSQVYRLEDPEAPTAMDDVVEELESTGQYGGQKAANDDPLEGEVLPRDREGTDVVPSNATAKSQDGDIDVENGPTDLEPDSPVGEDWRHMNEGKQTFNTDRIETLDDVKGFIEAASSQWTKKRASFADPNPEGVETLDEAYKKSKKVIDDIKAETGLDMEDVLNEYKHDVEELRAIRARAQAMRQLNVALGERVYELARKQAEGGLLPDEAAEFLEKAGLFSHVMEQTKLASREFSRGLGNYRIIMKGDAELLDSLHSKNGNAMGDVDALSKTIMAMTEAGKRKMGANAADAGKPMSDAQRRGFNLRTLKDSLDKATDGTWLQEVIRFRSAMMLSGPSTIESAAISNFIKLLTEPFVEYVAHLLPGAANRLGRKRALAQWVGTQQYFVQSWKQAFRAYKNGQHITDPFVTKIEGQSDKSLANMSGVRRNLWERGIHQAHLLLLFLDEGIKANRARALNFANAVVEAEQKGVPVQSGDFHELLAARSAKTFDRNGRVRDKEILREVREATYTSELEGDIGELITKAANFGGGLGRLFVVPFIRAPINILSEGLMYFPGSKIISAKQQNIMANGSEIAQKKLKARKVMGTAFIGSAWFLAENDTITGAGPSDYKMNELWRHKGGYQPYSIRVGDQWISYRKLEPLATVLGIVADANYLTKMATDGTNTDSVVSELLGGVMYAVTENILNKAYFSSVQQFMQAMGDADKFEKYINSWVGSFTPNLLAQLNDDPNMREAVTLTEQIQRRIPGLSKELGMQYDLYGRPIVKPAHDIPVLGFMFKNMKIEGDTVADEMLKLSEGLGRAVVQKPMYSLGVPKKDFREIRDHGETESVYAKYNRLIGEVRDPDTGKSLHETLDEVMHSDWYNDLPDSAYEDINSPKATVIQKYVNMYRAMAKEELHEQSIAYRDSISDRNNRIETMWDF